MVVAKTGARRHPGGRPADRRTAAPDLLSGDEPTRRRAACCSRGTPTRPTSCGYCGPPDASALLRADAPAGLEPPGPAVRGRLVLSGVPRRERRHARPAGPAGGRGVLGRQRPAGPGGPGGAGRADAGPLPRPTRRDLAGGGRPRAGPPQLPGLRRLPVGRAAALRRQPDRAVRARPVPDPDRGGRRRRRRARDRALAAPALGRPGDGARAAPARGACAGRPAAGR